MKFSSIVAVKTDSRPSRSQPPHRAEGDG